MRPVLGAFIAAFIGATLAVATTVGVVQVSQMSPENTPNTVESPEVYGER